MSYLGAGVIPGTVPVYSGINLKVLDRRVRVAELVLRCVILGLGVFAAILVGTDTQVEEIFSFQKKAKFTDMKALVFLVVACALAAGYSLIQGLRCVVSMVRGTVLFSKPLAWIIFFVDQAMAYVTVAAVSAAGQSAVFAKVGQPELQWMKICDMYGKFCNQMKIWDWQLSFNPVLREAHSSANYNLSRDYGFQELDFPPAAGIMLLTLSEPEGL